MIGLGLAIVDYETGFNIEDRKTPEGIETIKNSLVRVIVSLTTVLALIALLFRMWLYTFWSEYKN